MAARPLPRHVPFRHDADAAAGRLLAALAAALLAALLLGAAIAYLSDAKVQASVQDKSCSPTGSEVDVRTKWLGIDHTVTDIPFQTCAAIQPGNFVEYRLRSQRTTLFAAEGGDCIYDSEKGLC